MIRYSLSRGDPNHHLFDVRLAFTAPVHDPLVHLPAWRPGRYLIRNSGADDERHAFRRERLRRLE